MQLRDVPGLGTGPEWLSWSRCSVRSLSCWEVRWNEKPAQVVQEDILGLFMIAGQVK